MAGRRVRDERDARSCLEAVEASGMGRAEWARAHGVEPRSLNAWRVNLERGVRGKRGRGLLELVPAGRPDAPTTYIVRCGPFSVEVGKDFDERALGRLLTVVAGC
jgi:hypothetical protein